jgi:hypothetical protein
VLQTRLFAPLAANPTKLAIAVLVGLLLLGLGLLALRRMQQSQLAFARKAVDFVHGIWGGVLAAGRLKKPFSFVALTVAMWLLYFLGPYFTLFAFPFTSHLGVQAGLFVLLFGSIGFVAPVQGGIGAYHLMVTEGLLLLGIARTDGLAFATVVHGGQMVMVLIFGAIGVLVSRKTPLPFSKVEFETKTGLKTKQ